MLKNYLKITFRNLWRSKGFSIINISGLAIGMASAVLILLWIQNEISFDKFHEKEDRLYQAWNRGKFDNKLQCWSTTPKILGPTLKQEYPEVEKETRVNWNQSFLFSVGEKRLTVSGTMVDPDFLHMFSFPLIKGDAGTALNSVYSIVLTEKLSKKLFGNDEAMGKIVKLDNKDNFTVTGIMKDLPNNTMFDFEYLLPWSYMQVINQNDSNWDNNSTQNYVLLKENASLSAFNSKIKNITIDHLNGKEQIEVFLYPLSKLHLYSKFENGVVVGGKIDMVRLFAIIAAFILLIACINFMNLSTARSEKRAREVGIRKVVGAQKHTLIGQFLGESVLLAFLSGLLALVIVQFSLPAFNALVSKHLFIHYDNIYFWLAAFAFIFFTGILAGSYPAFYLSSYKPVAVLKGTFKAVNALITPRKVLVVLQFTFAITLIICTMIVQQQIKFAQERDMGYNKNNLIYHFLTGDIEKNYTLIKNELLASGAATAVTKSSAPITQAWSDSWGFMWEGKDPNDKTDFDRYYADEDLVKTAGLQIVQGRDFDLKNYPTDSTAIILNESSVKAMNFKNPIGQIIKDNGKDWHVVGVIKDFILRSPYEPMRPMVIGGSKGWFNVMHIKLNSNNTTRQNLHTAETIFKKYNPQYPFESHFVDEDYAKKFNDEQRIQALAGLFAGLTIFISCLGLFGLATYMAENRIKEIGVRKVLGASVMSITSLLSKDFLKLVFISLVIASPVAWWSMYTWLQGYPYHINIQWWVFTMAGMLSIIVALLTVSYQSIKAAISNPVKSLRSE
jgi:ABC-type antimicrobial peptide transport system, permease component